MNEFLASKTSSFKRTLKQMRLSTTSYLFISPYMLIFAVFTLAPVLYSLYYGFTYYNILEPPKFIGFQNYLNLFLNDDIFLIAIKNTFVIAAITGPVGYLASLIFAWFISELPPKIRAIMVVIFYAPSISGSAYLIWSLIFSSDSYGYLNAMLINLGFISEPIQWFTNTKYMMLCVIIVMLWMSLGSGFLSMVAGFQNMDKALYEAGYVEGIRNRWQELWFITIPQMRPQMMFSAVMSITSSFAVGDVTSMLCGFPSTDYAVHTIVNHMYDYGNVRFEMGYACAISTVLFTTMLVLNSIIQKALSKIGN